MPLETLQSALRQPARAAAPPPPPRPRLRAKGPVGPDFYRQCPSATARPKQSAVERLEADKVKYVKSQVALSKQQPVRAAEGQRPALSPSAALRPTRKTQTPTKPQNQGVQLDLERLTHLISDVPDEGRASGAAASEASRPECAAAASDGSTSSSTVEVEKKEKPTPPPRTDWSTPAKVRLKASGPARLEVPASPGAPAVGTVRRVDVMPGAGLVRPPPSRPPLYLRQPLQPLPPLPPQFPLRPAASNLRLFHTRTTPGVSPLKPVVAPSKPDASSPDAPEPAPPPPPALPAFPPASPAVTRRSSSSSRKRPSLTRSKSDMSDRCSRAGTELERFFNLCGLDPAELQEWTGSSSDIVSMARFRSVSAPGSEVAGSNREEEEEEEEEEKASSRVPYGVSVIERNARVIKWLYGLRHAKDGAGQSTNL